MGETHRETETYRSKERCVKIHMQEIKFRACRTEEGSPPQGPHLFPHLYPRSLEGKGQAFMLSLPTDLHIPSLQPELSIVSMAGAGVMQTTSVVVGSWGQLQVSDGKEK